MSAAAVKRWLAALLLALHAGIATAAEAPQPSQPAPVILGEPPAAPAARALPSAALASEALAIQALPPGGLVIDTQDREAVRTFYRGVFFQSEDVPIVWTGNYAAGDAGTTAQAFRDAVALRVNWYRALAGVPANITFSDVFNGKDQQAALMMSANGLLSHSPPPSWLYYTAAGAEAAGASNLSLGNNGVRALLGQMRDNGASNSPLGHRRWLLYPQTRIMGTGDVPGGLLNTTAVSPAHALWVLDGNFGAPRPATRDSFVAWPPKGHVPYPVVYGRWSLSYPNADFSAATVSVSRNGTALPVVIEYRSNTTTPNFGEDTIVWTVNGLNDASIYPKPPADETYLVTISGVSGSGVPPVFSYNVTVFDPDVATPGAPLTTASAPATVATGVAFTAAVAPMPGATGYQLELNRSSALGGTLTPANSAASWTQFTGGYNALEAAEFHLYHATFDTQLLTLAKPLYAGAGASVTFERRFGFTTATEVARMQVSLDGGVSWQDVHSEAGTGATVPYASRNVSLAAYAGRTLRLRFAFTFSGSVFQCNTCGWYFRNIAFNNVSELTPAVQTTLSAASPSASLTAATAGSHVLLARAEYQGSYFGDWGPGLAITAAPPSLGAPTAVTAVVGNAAITVRYTAAASNGPPITGYTATCTSSNGGAAGSNSAAASATSIRVSGLTDGKSYTCTVRASNASGPGPVSAPSNRVTLFDLTPILNLLLSD